MKLKNLFTIILFILPMALYAQDTIYVDQYGDKTKLKIFAESYRLVSRDSAVNEGKIVREYYLSGKLKSECHQVVETDEKTKKKNDSWEGPFKMWYESGQLKRDIDYHKGKIDGKLTTYWENGKVKRHDLYQEDKSLEGKCYDENGSETTYYPYHIMPEFPGGEKVLMLMISRNLKYPIEAQEAGVQGKVVVHFVVDKAGEMKNITVIKSLFPALDLEAQRVVSILPPWTPGKIDGEIATEEFILPIKFNLEVHINTNTGGFRHSTF
ncbi:MAG: TonB family protein [Paludibacter sp.]|nr:TonB family protein [Paludibacter sp.]